MASKVAQVPKICELCEIDSKIRWKCFQCNILMCDKCKKIHSKVQTSTKHDIVDLNSDESIRDIGRHVSLKSTPCDSHQRQTHCLFCKTCTVLVCPECIASSHNGHDLESLNTHFENRIDELQKKAKRIDKTVVPFLATRREEMKKFQSVEHSKYKNTRQEIVQQEINLKTEIGKYSALLLQEVDKNWADFETRLSENNSLFERYEEIVQLIRKRINDTLQSGSATEILELVQEMQSEELKTHSEIHMTRREFLRAGSSDISSVFGALCNKAQSLYTPIQDPQKVKIEVENTYSMNKIIPNIVRLLFWKTDILWVSSSEKHLLKVNVDFRGDVIVKKSVKDINVCMDMITCPDSDDVLVSLLNDSRIMSLTPDGKLTNFLTFDRMQPLGIHFNKAGDLVCGIREVTSSAFTVHKDSRRQIRIIGKDKNEKQIYEYTANNKRLFTAPVSITSIEQYIYVADKLNSDGDGRLLALEPTGKVRWIYSDKNFKPWSLATTQNNYIIIGEHGNDSIRVLSDNGTANCSIKSLGLQLNGTFCVNIDNYDNLWIGYGDGKNANACKAYKAKITFP